MTINEQCKIIADSNEVLLAKIVKLIITKFNITTDILLDSTNNNLKQYISFLLLRVYSDNYKLLELREEIKERGTLLQEYINTMVQGDNMNVTEQGRNTGGKKGKADDTQIKLIQLKEDQRKRISEYDNASKRIAEEHQDIKCFIELLPQPQFARIMTLSVFEAKKDADIARAMSYVPSAITNIKCRALQELATLIKKHLKK